MIRWKAVSLGEAPRQTAAKPTEHAIAIVLRRRNFVPGYSVRNATIGFTRVARRAGTKHEIAATKVRRPETTR
jgi:hypothetical protein